MTKSLKPKIWIFVPFLGELCHYHVERTSSHGLIYINIRDDIFYVYCKYFFLAVVKIYLS